MYVDAYKDNKQNKVHTVNRINGQRIYKSYDIDWSFYVPDPKGEYKSWFGNPLMKVTPRSAKEHEELSSAYGHGQLFEADVNYVFRCFEQEYPDTTATPDLHVAFFDIETDFDKELGYSSPEDAFNEITSIAVYLQWAKTMVCLAVPPKTLTMDEAKRMTRHMSDVILFDTERDMLAAFLDIIEDADVLSGWNSQFYDIPYTVRRIEQVLGSSETRKLCLWQKKPRPRRVEFGGKDSLTYVLEGRIHLDYLELYKSYTYEQKHSYSLNSIAEIELGDTKVEYDGTLDQLYNNDFVKFLEYNIQDTMLLDRLDQKLQYVNLLNTITHANQVTFAAAQGTVSMMEQVITVEAHSRGFRVPVRKPSQGAGIAAAGGWVSRPKKGYHRYVGSSDLNSLYPSVIRAFNMSPETIRGQIDLSKMNAKIFAYIEEKAANSFAGWWNDKFHVEDMEKVYSKDDTRNIVLTLEENGKQSKAETVSGAQISNLIFGENNLDWCITANGTIFDNSVEGVVPGLLSRWYRERKEKQKVMKRMKVLEGSNVNAPASIANTAEIDTPVSKANVYDFPLDEFDELLANDVEQPLLDFMREWGLTVHTGAEGAVIAPQREWKTLYKYACDYWDKQQLVRKINLNSCYGGLLNEHMKFFDQRIGQSTTLSGRSITRHMTCQTALLLEGVYDWEKTKCIIYNDTDSVYFSAWPLVKDDVESGKMQWDKDTAVELYDNVSDMVSDSFPEFLNKTFNVPLDRGQIIASGREIVAESAIYTTKKRYAALVYDDEGVRKDIDGSPGKLKAMGLDLRRADTPVFVQDFLKKILLATLTGSTEKEIADMILKFKENNFRNKPKWECGVPKAVNNLYKYTQMREKYIRDKLAGLKPAKPKIPGHVQASINWNQLRDEAGDNNVPRITDGSKIIVAYLKEGKHEFTSIAYPVDETRLPEWFTSLPFDIDDMEERIIDKKVENLLGTMKWDLRNATSKQTQLFDSLFG